MFFTPPPLHSCTSPFYFLCVVWVEAFLRLLVPLKQGRGLFECCTNVIYIIPKESSLFDTFFFVFRSKSSCCCFLIVNPQKKRDSRSCAWFLVRFFASVARERERERRSSLFLFRSRFWDDRSIASGAVRARVEREREREIPRDLSTLTF